MCRAGDGALAHAARSSSARQPAETGVNSGLVEPIETVEVANAAAEPPMLPGVIVTSAVNEPAPSFGVSVTDTGSPSFSCRYCARDPSVSQSCARARVRTQVAGDEAVTVFCARPVHVSCDVDGTNSHCEVCASKLSVPITRSTSRRTNGLTATVAMIYSSSCTLCAYI